jgi:hypothetical protein
MGLKLIKFKDVPEEHQERIREEWESDPLNHDEEIEPSQLILTDL